MKSRTPRATPEGPPPEPLPPQQARRELNIAVVALLAASTLAFLSGGQVWARLPVDLGIADPVGADLGGLVGAAGVVGLAAAFGVVASSGRGRMGVGLLVAMVGAAVMAAGLDAAVRTDAAVGRFLEVVAPEAVDAGSTVSADATLWPWVGLLAGTLLVVVGCAAYVRADDWPTMSTRYERPGNSSGSTSPSRTDTQLWDELDQGKDPTDS